MSTKEERRQNVIEVLNKARAMELQSIHQYMSQHYRLDDMDYGELAKNMKLIAIDEMRHAEAFAERVKELGGEPTTELAGEIAKRQDIKTIFSYDSNEEDNAIDSYNQFLLVCRDNGDSISVKLLDDIINDEQEHFNYFDAINDHIQQLGDAYLSRIAGTPSSTGLQPQGFVIAGSAE
ncbi:ferritin-like domain-containing protein [Maridesulfovibrio bastinii]|uniref:ferritin-like domain-containing protein n=1 Tax=Maridesulfovibrio bastinii TaxID=47157 RepID=UPI0004238EDF|nr:ferritin-like domain-containing protein [Maridesulfovibrio bastinii]